MRLKCDSHGSLEEFSEANNAIVFTLHPTMFLEKKNTQEIRNCHSRLKVKDMHTKVVHSCVRIYIYCTPP